jgi:hypothetical protein
LGNGNWRTGDASCRIPEGCWPVLPAACGARAVPTRTARRDGRAGGGGRWPVTVGCGAVEPCRAAGGKARPRRAPARGAAHPEQAVPAGVRGPPESRGRRRRSVGTMRGPAARRGTAPQKRCWRRLGRAVAGRGASGRRRHRAAPRGGAGGRG